MPVQTTKTTNIYFPDGAVVALKADGEATYTDVGAINSAVTATLNWDENQVETANAGKTIKQVNNMTIEGAFTLVNLEIDSIERMGGGVFEVVDTAASPISTIPDQTISATWADQTLYDLDMEVSSTDSTKVRTSSAPSLSSVTLDPGEPTAETLDANSDYVVVANDNSPSGWSIQFISSSMGTSNPTTKDIEIDYDSNTPIASSTLYCGSSTAQLTAYAMQITHTDSDSKVRRLTLYSVDPNTGGFQFNFKGANEDGLEEMPLAFTAKLDTSLTDGRQLMAWTVEDGAE